jgi:hypothetical protein
MASEEDISHTEQSDNIEKTQQTENSDSVNGLKQMQSANPTISSNDINSASQPNNEAKATRHPSVALSINVPQSEESTQESIDQNDGQNIHNDQNGEVGPDQLQKSISKVDETDMDEYDPDLYITDEERKAFEYMLEQRRDEIIKQRENFKNWVYSITRRRMFALSRLRKINKCHKERMKFYDQIDDYVKTADQIIQSNDRPTLDSSMSDPGNELFKDMIRENTGFVINNEKEMNSDNENYSVKGSNNNENTKTSNTKTNNEGLKNGSNVHITTNSNVDDDSKQTISSNNDNTPKIVPVQS